MPSLASNPVLAFSDQAPSELEVYRRVNLQTDCPYPFLAATHDRSTSLLIGNLEACFELVPSGETRRWLPDFAATRMRLPLELVGICALVQHAFPDRVDCGVVQFDAELRVCGLKLVLVDEGGEVEYVIHTFGLYERVGRDKRHRVSAAETALLHLCCTMGSALARRAPGLLREPASRGQSLTKGLRTSAVARSR